MDTIFNNLNDFFKNLTTLLFNLFSIGILTEIIFGNFFGIKVIDSITTVVSKLGNEGFVGIIAILILLSFFNKDRY
tara:strand:- start:1510 stop:1737 length:228 start_codon:yes stop_codon:yes gene_type:complete